MRKTRRISITLAIASVCTVTFYKFPANAFVGVVAVPKATCRIEVDNAHISSTLLKHRKRNYIKVVARSICNKNQQSVTLTLEIHKVGQISDHIVGNPYQTNPLSSSSSGYEVDLSSASILCKDFQISSYYGIAYSKAIIEGQWRYAGKTRSPKIVPLACGTWVRIKICPKSEQHTYPLLYRATKKNLRIPFK